MAGENALRRFRSRARRLAQTAATQLDRDGNFQGADRIRELITDLDAIPFPENN